VRIFKIAGQRTDNFFIIRAQQRSDKDGNLKAKIHSFSQIVFGAEQV